MFDFDAYELHLAAVRTTVFHWDPMQHPRDLNGRWKGVEIKHEKLGSVFDRKDAKLPSNTQDLHTVQDKRGGWHYTKERNQLHKDIVAKYLEGATDGKRILFTAGGAGSGKTEGLKKLPDLVPEGAVNVDPDEIKLLLPEYKRLVEEGNPKAATLVHDESIDVAQKLLQAALWKNKHTVMDGTGASPMFLNRIEWALKEGYDVNVAYFNTDTKTALDRIEARRKATGRAVNEQVARGMHRNASRLFEDVYNLGTGLVVYDTTGLDPKRIAHAEGGADIEFDDPDAFKAFLAKANEPSPYAPPPAPVKPPGTKVAKPNPKPSVNTAPATQTALPIPAGGGSSWRPKHAIF